MFTLSARALTAALAALALSAAAAGAGQIPERRTEGSSIDFVALGADGRAVSDLTAADLAVKIDGRTRAVLALQLVTVADPVAGTAEAPPIPAPFGRSAGRSGGRSIVIVIDQDSIRVGGESRLREGVHGLLAGLGRQDRVSFVTVPYGGVKVPLTGDSSRTERALITMTGQAPQSETGSEMACRTRRVLESVAGLLDTYAGHDGPLTVLFVSNAMAGARRDAEMTHAPGMCELTSDHFRQVAEAAARAHANFYVIQPDDAPLGGGPRTENIAGTGFTGSDNPLEGLENLAGVTGGERLHMATTADALSRVLAGTAAYYVATLEPEPSDGNGRSHRLEVRVGRPNVTVRTRPGVIFAKAGAAGSGARRLNAREMLRVPDGFGDVPVRATAYVSEGGGDGTLKVTFVLEPIEPATRFASAAAGLIDESDRLVAQWSAADMDASPLMGALTAPPGSYRLRVAVTDAAGAGGAAEDRVLAALTPAGTLTLSSLVLGLSRPGGFVPTLQFGSEPVALASFEIYGGVAGARLMTALDVARTVDGAALVAGRLTLERIGEGHYLATGAIPLGALPPGDFVVRAIVGIEGQTTGRIVRTLRKSPPR